ncbi:nucleoside-diphosphate-sugar epimerase [Rheinheimera pacifica]|uniref:UDP-glucose 4-epimerase family protein n=1 Tax=Rheinheimera pacifica TaxID=173990 RepID=UPI00286272AA|nr:SDR family oxidoreductase [Rheinheimera pacifica]MDR6984021.1 nucleoside-diphosphate-sugar epimerase [Rheinheimera pacifica]
MLLTGATGFIGSSLLTALVAKHYKLIAPSRTPLDELPENVTMPLLHDISALPDNSDWFVGCDVVIHIAAKAHVYGVSLAEFTRVNTEGTLRLAQLAKDAGVKRFIFLSSIGVNGIFNTTPFNVSDTPAPVEAYAASKFAAEQGLKQIAAGSDMELVIIRPPLVYGAGAPGNVSKLVTLVQKNLPLPLGAIHNKRSLVALDNLIDLIITCIDHPKAANQTFLVSDDQDVSTTELLQMMTRAAGKKPRLLPVPVSWLKLAGKLTGKQAVVDRLCGNLQVDISHTKETLAWKPPVTVEEGVARCFTPARPPSLPKRRE